MQQLYTLDNKMPKQYFDYCIKKYDATDYNEKEMIIEISEQAMKEIQILKWFHQYHNKQQQ
ncbi:unnamed protein product (macronuclear) [Paramecium tetraurelia]|uniref:Uncharacterized protein n=1 Tax=Paramecium tetraurelia TaxID=5888 RepID=A0CIR4_PARTE|nr:uncharacterized protein GSPATT00007816001 [Paramecium tetraurelia]CAK70681.1 unnamed protein product [Paramecium tetraurelia]|eukprot:XP_001438078.1 hypothetical protein (macronuclear) [Paramecium tetraurelia strain d4-2]